MGTLADALSGKRDNEKGREGREKLLRETTGWISTDETKAYSGTQSRRNFGRLKATLGDFSLFCPKLRAILGDLRRL